MNEQLTLQSTQHEETKTVPLRRRKACLAGTFALFAACALVLLIPHPAYAGIIGDFLDIPNMIKTWLLQIAATLSSFGYRANHAKYTHALAVVARFPPFDRLAYSEAERDEKTPEVHR